MKQYKEAMNCSGYINEKTDTEYRLEVKDKLIILSFQGSSSVLDYKQNFTFWKKPYKNMEHLFFVHAGLFNKYKSVQDDIFNIITPLFNPDWKLRIYGFSQGGTLATFAHEDAVYRFPKSDIETYAFAPAKGFTFCNRKFLKTRFKNLNTIIVKKDIIPKLPFWFQGFIHYGNIKKK